MQLIELVIDKSGSLKLSVSGGFLVIFAAVVVVICLMRWIRVRKFRTSYQIDEAEIGIGSSKVKIRPNREDLKIAYQLWVELKTRKLGITIDESNDIIHELYNSWYEFFGITRELIKAIPAEKIRLSADTRALVELAMKVLNEGLRPHLTMWNSRYRRWYAQKSEEEAMKTLPPQRIQREYEAYPDLIADMKRVNEILVRYAELLKSMIDGKDL